MLSLGNLRSSPGMFEISPYHMNKVLCTPRQIRGVEPRPLARPGARTISLSIPARPINGGFTGLPANLRGSTVHATRALSGVVRHMRSSWMEAKSGLSQTVRKLGGLAASRLTPDLDVQYRGVGLAGI